MTNVRRGEWIEDYKNVTDPTMFATATVVENALQLTAKWETVSSFSLHDMNKKLMQLSEKFHIILIIANDRC